MFTVPLVPPSLTLKPTGKSCWLYLPNLFPIYPPFPSISITASLHHSPTGSIAHQLLFQLPVLPPFITKTTSFFLSSFFGHRPQQVGSDPLSGIKLVPSTMEAQILNHWTAREVPWAPFSKPLKSPLLISVIIFGGLYSYVAVSLINLDLLEHRHYLFSSLLHGCHAQYLTGSW